jgi:hypothetical protein
VEGEEQAEVQININGQQSSDIDILYFIFLILLHANRYEQNCCLVLFVIFCSVDIYGCYVFHATFNNFIDG